MIARKIYQPPAPRRLVFILQGSAVKFIGCFMLVCLPLLGVYSYAMAALIFLAFNGGLALLGLYDLAVARS